METKTFCGKMCGASCGIIITTEDGKITNIRGDPEYPPTRGFICAKGRAFTELVYHPERITKPLIRVGDRGSGQWREITTEEALEYIRDKINAITKTYGTESVVLHRGAHRNDLVTDMLIRLGKAIGTPNIANLDNVCSMARVFADVYTYGTKSFPDTVTPSKCILVWGRNSLETGSESMINIFPAARQNKAELLVIDPRKTSIAAQATQWIKPKPSSDGYLALALIKTIIDERLYDADFIENWTIGFDELKELVSEYSYEELSEATWIPVEDIKSFARTYATTKPASIQTGNPIDQTPNAFHTARLISILRAITGNLDTPGGDYLINNPPLNNLQDTQDKSTRPMIGKEYTIASRAYLTPSQETLKAALTGEPYPVKASILMGTNPLLTYADTEKTREAMMKLDLIVAVEYFQTETTEIADIILPAAAQHEYEDLSPRAGHINTRPKLIEPPDDARSDIQWINLLAETLGVGDRFWETEEEVFDYVLEPIGWTYRKLVENGTLWVPRSYNKHQSDGFKTPSGKVEIYSQRLAEQGINPIPKITPQTTNTIEYPLVLTTGKDYYSYHSSWRQLPSLRERSPEPYVELNPETIKKYRLKEDGYAVIEAKEGCITQRVKPNPSLDPRIVYAAFGWGKEANLNYLTSWDTELCPAMGAATHRGIPCRIRLESH
ncbi:MAG: molybdopterin-dependent oxidoreductase [Candidatus Bathyarchaeota archaeon]|nr:molybdopterin-dependent oxidoreductase [Candidatus Bathyarchaeota archaeon]